MPSGPLWDDTAINQPGLWDQPWKRAHRIHWRHGPAQGGPYEPDTPLRTPLAQMTPWRQVPVSDHTRDRGHGRPGHGVAADQGRDRGRQDGTPDRADAAVGQQVQHRQVNPVRAAGAQPGSQRQDERHDKQVVAEDVQHHRPVPQRGPGGALVEQDQRVGDGVQVETDGSHIASRFPAATGRETMAAMAAIRPNEPSSTAPLDAVTVPGPPAAL